MFTVNVFEVLLATSIVFVFFILSRKVVINLLEPFLLGIYISIFGSMILLIAITMEGLFEVQIFTYIVLLFFVFFLGVFFSSAFFNFSKVNSNIIQILSFLLINHYRKYKKFFFFAFFLYIFIYYLFGFILITSGETGGYRLAIYKKHTVLNVIRIFLEFYIQFILSFLIREQVLKGSKLIDINKMKINLYLFMFILILFGHIISGSKGAAALSIIFVLYILIGYKHNIVTNIRIIINNYAIFIILSLLVTLLSITLFYEKSILASIMFLYSAFILRGDSYLILTVLDIDDYYGKYNFLLYHLHHILRLFGYRGYDVPLGTALAADYQGVDYQNAVGGVNVHLPLLSLVLLKGNLLMASLYCLVAGLLFPLLRKVLYTKFVRLSCSGGLRIYHFVYLYLFFYYPTLLIDQNTFSYYLTSMFAGSSIFYIVILIIIHIKRLMQKINTKKGLN